MSRGLNPDSGEGKMSYTIPLQEVEQTLKRVIDCGYGETIQIIINGEYYDLVEGENGLL